MSGWDWSGVSPAVALVLGLIFGSFANVCIHRVPRGESVVTPRSRCPGCGATIRWYDNIPVLSWMWLAARCRGCRARIPWSYPLVEASMGAGFLFAHERYGLTVDGFAAAWLCFACIVLAVIDKRHFILPDVLTLSGLAAGLLFALVRGLDAAMVEAGPSGAAVFLGGAFAEPPLPLASLAGAAAGASMPLVARGVYILGRGRRRASGDDPEAIAGSVAGEDLPVDPDREVAEAALAEGMGLGDVKMMAMVGAFLGARLALVTILLGSVAGCLVVLPWLAVSGRGMKTPVPFGPFLAAGALASLFAGDLLAGAYAEMIRRLVF